MSLLRAVRLIVTEQKPIFALHPMAVALGSALASLGIEPQPYKASKIYLMSQLVTTSEVRAVVGELRRQQVMDVLRGATFIGALLVAWVSLRPFIDLGNAALKDLSTGNETPTYLAFGVLAVLTSRWRCATTCRDCDAAVAGLHAVRRLDRTAAWCCRSIPAPRSAASR